MNVNSIVSRRKISDISALPQFSVAPAPKCVRDKKEWGLFLNFMHKHDMVWHFTFSGLHSINNRVKLVLFPALCSSFEWLNQNQCDSVFQIAITSFEQCKFYILPPPKAYISGSVNVAYQIGSTCNVDTRSRDCESGFHSYFITSQCQML